MTREGSKHGKSEHGKSDRQISHNSNSSKSSQSKRRPKHGEGKNLPRTPKSGKGGKNEEEGSTKSSPSSSSKKPENNSSSKKKKKYVEFNAEERKQHRILTAAERPKLDAGDVVSAMNHKWEVISLLGSGGFGDVYKVKLENPPENMAEFGAMKTELLNENKHPMMNRLKIELAILKLIETLPPEKRTYFTDMYDRGITSSFKFIVMELVGQSIYAIQKISPKREFSITTSLKLGLQTLDAVDNLHEIGYLHRDIKPHNYSVGIGKKSNLIYMLDFGIARRYVKSGTKVLRIPRECVKFLGTLKYASRACHLNKEQSRKDDLESWYYMQLEFVDHSSIFWAAFKDRKQVLVAKEKLFGNECTKNLEHIPPEVLKLIQYIDGLIFTSTPDYEYMRALLCQCAKANELDLSEPFDWENHSNRKIKRWKKKKHFGLFGSSDKPKKKEPKKDKEPEKEGTSKEGKDKETTKDKDKDSERDE